jgi:ClpA/ClpB-like protein
MFEHYTEKARRVIFFARYEASQLGSPYIETEHLLLGILREDKSLVQQCLPIRASEAVRKSVDAMTPTRSKVSTSVDLPLSPASKRVLAEAGEESDRLKHKHIGTEHLLLGLLREENETAAQILRELGVNLAEARERIAVWRREPSLTPTLASRLRTLAETSIQIHGAGRNPEHVRSIVAHYQRRPWHWRQEVWLPRDVAEHLETGQISFDLSLATDPTKYRLIQGGWASDNCVVCGWRLFESSILAHGTGHTNGRDWLCTECYERFFVDSKPGLPPLPDIT